MPGLGRASTREKDLQDESPDVVLGDGGKCLLEDVENGTVRALLPNLLQGDHGKVVTPEIVGDVRKENVPKSRHQHRRRKVHGALRRPVPDAEMRTLECRLKMWKDLLWRVLEEDVVHDLIDTEAGAVAKGVEEQRNAPGIRVSLEMASYRVVHVNQFVRQHAVSGKGLMLS